MTFATGRQRWSTSFETIAEASLKRAARRLEIGSLASRRRSEDADPHILR